MEDEENFITPVEEYRFIHPARILFAGVTMAGKSKTIMKCMDYENEVFNVKFQRIIFAVPSESVSQLHEENVKHLKTLFDNVELCIDFPVFSDIFTSATQHLKTCIIMEEFFAQGNFANDPRTLDLLAAKSHHLNFTLMISSQSYYFEGKFAPHIRKQFTDIVLFKNRGNKQDLLTLNRQIFPSYSNFLILCFKFIEENCEKDQQFLVLDKGPLSKLPEHLQARCNIFPINNHVSEPIFLCPISNK